MAELTALTDRTGHAEQPRTPPVVYIVAARARAAYLKALFAKVGVASRGELVARLFADHYHGQLAGTTSTMLDPA